jgi:hypothetical protein
MTPRLTTASIDPATGEAVIYADGVPALRLTTKQALWLLARLAEALASRR